MMSSTEPDSRLLTGVTVSSLACVAIALLAGALVASAGPTPGRAGAASLAFALTALTCFATAIVLAMTTGRLVPALWGYVPGLLCVLASGLWISESMRAAGSAASPWPGALVGLNPEFWVPIVATFGLATDRRRRQRARRCQRPRIR